MSLRSWTAFGTGAGIEIAPDALRVVITRVRPSGVEVAGAHVIENFIERPAAEWGAEYSTFLRKHGADHLAATVCLPRKEVTVRLVALPGVEKDDLEAALRLQIDTLHPFPEGEAAWSWARLGNTSSLLVGIARQAVVDRYTERFAEAGVKVASISFSAALAYGGLRLLSEPPAEGFLGLSEAASGTEVYGESPARLVYSATYDQPWERAAVLAASELRLTENFHPRELADLVPPPKQVSSEDSRLSRSHTVAYLAALAAACPRLALPVNLLPLAERVQNVRWIYVPTIVLGVLLIAAFAAIGFYGRYEDQKYLHALDAEIASLEPRSRRVAQLDQRADQLKARIQLLDRFQTRTKADLDALKETNRVIPPPAWLNTLELTRTGMVVAGEADQATGLLRALDNSPHFQASEFLIPLSRVGNVEVFRIRSLREGAVQ